MFDINRSGQPVVQDIAPMHYPRQWANSLVLSDGQVLVTGGSTFADNNGPNAVYAAEIWNPKTGQWTVGANAANYRGYHSATALLPDGTVLSMGGGGPGPVSNFNAEIYYPPYFFTKSGAGSVLATRPHIVSLSSTWSGYAGQDMDPNGHSRSHPGSVADWALHGDPLIHLRDG
jgi:galactose oxidase